LAAGLVIIAAVLRALLLPIGYGAKFTTFYPAVTMAFYVAGARPGIFAIFLSALLTQYFFLPPYHTFELTPEGATSLLLFIAAAGMCGYFVSRMHQYRKSLVEAERIAAEDRVEEANENLSLAVDGARLGVWRFLPADQLFTFSDRFAQHFGLPVGVNVVSR
jgi:K+-sensing histidine kinase KdpD